MSLRLFFELALPDSSVDVNPRRCFFLSVFSLSGEAVLHPWVPPPQHLTGLPCTCSTRARSRPRTLRGTWWISEPRRWLNLAHLVYFSSSDEEEVGGGTKPDHKRPAPLPPAPPRTSGSFGKRRQAVGRIQTKGLGEMKSLFMCLIVQKLILGLLLFLFFMLLSLISTV